MLSQARHKALYGGLSSIHQKIYSVVPSDRTCTASDVLTELRSKSVSQDPKAVSWCLMHLVETGLAREPQPGRFIRIGVKTKAANEPAPHQEEPPALEPETMPALQAIPQTPPADPTSAGAIDRLGKIAADALRISESLKKLASDIETAALEIDSQFAAEAQKTAKLRQLQNLLKGLGD